MLIVEDDINAREAMKQYFLRQGYDTQVALTSAQAIAKGKVMKPDLLITDWMLEPDGDGLEVAKVLKKMNPRLKTILITAYSGLGLRDHARAVNALVLEKPISLTELGQAVDRQLH